jgi:pyridinium-3,5-bisthiocarboxylic acid mononucleotide nickel chelatase
VRILFLDCSAGIAGDMLLGALVDVGADTNYIREQLEKLDLANYELRFDETTRSGLRSLKANVLVSDEPPRTYQQIKALVAGASLDRPVAEGATEAFARIAEAEQRVHGVEEPHFHEVGSTDALVDVIASVTALHSLEVDRVVASRVAVGSGRTRSEHGSLPVPAPATLEILKTAKIPLYAGGEGELTTPTGAALLAVITDEFKELPEMTPVAAGHGAGSRERDVPNILRAIIGHDEVATGDERVTLEANLDDMAPELFPHVIDRLLEAGADDAWITPIVMKKGRPAFKLSALTARHFEADVARVFFVETTTLGLRASSVAKTALERDWVLVDIEGSPVQVKVARFEGRVTNVAPEYEDAVAAARTSGIPLREVYRRAVAQAEEQLRTAS